MRMLRGVFMRDESILKELTKGNIHAFEYVVNYYEKKIYCFIYNMVHNTETAEDLTQDTFIKVYKNCYKYNPELPFEPWLFKIAYNIIINYLKKNKHIIKEISIENVEHDVACPNDGSLDFETRDLILKEINSLKPDIRTIMYLHIIEDLSFYQISEILGISDSSVKLKFYRNRKTLIKKLIIQEELI